MGDIIEFNENKYQVITTENNGNSIWQSIYNIEIINDIIYYYTKDDCELTENITESEPMAKLYVCSRGVWDNRIYFPNDNEYMMQEFLELVQVIEGVEKISMGIIKNNT